MTPPQRGARSARGDGWRLAALSLALSLALGVAVAEAWLRADDFSYYWALAQYPDAELGWTPLPGATAWQRFEGEARIAINARGFRDALHPLGKPPGSLRVAVLGDSFTAAVQVPRERTWWRRMAARLDGCAALGGRTPEVLNFGVSGYSTAQELLAWRHRAAAYAPDVVVLGFFPGNDLVENVPGLEPGPPERPYFRLEDGALVLDDRFRRRTAFRLLDSAPGRAAYRLRARLRVVQAVLRARDVLRLALAPVPEDRGEPREPGVDNRIYRPPGDPLWERSWAVTEALVGRLATDVRGAGAVPVVLSFSTGAQVHPDPAFRAAYARAVGAEDLYYPGGRLEALASRQGFVARDLAPDMAWLASWSGAWLHGFPPDPGTGHWNAEGHRVAGEMAAATVCQALSEPAMEPARKPDDGAPTSTGDAS